MPQDQDGDTFALGFRAVQDRVPSTSGVYTIFTSRRWLFVGESADIRQSLFGHLNDPDASWAAESQPLSFSFEVADATERVTRSQARAAELGLPRSA